MTIGVRRELVLIDKAATLHPVRGALNVNGLEADGESVPLERIGQLTNGKRANKGAVGNMPHCGYALHNSPRSARRRLKS